MCLDGSRFFQIGSGLQSTYTAGEEINLSARVTNGVPVPSDTTFDWYVDGVAVVTNGSQDFTFSTTDVRDHDITVLATSNGVTDVVASDTAYVGIPNGYHLVDEKAVDSQPSTITHFSTPFETSGTYFFRVTGTNYIAGQNTGNNDESDDREADAVSYQNYPSHTWVPSMYPNVDISNVPYATGSWSRKLTDPDHAYISDTVHGSNSDATVHFVDAVTTDNGNKDMKVQMFAFDPSNFIISDIPPVSIAHRPDSISTVTSVSNKGKVVKDKLLKVKSSPNGLQSNL